MKVGSGKLGVGSWELGGETVKYYVKKTMRFSKLKIALFYQAYNFPLLTPNF